MLHILIFYQAQSRFVNALYSSFKKFANNQVSCMFDIIYSIYMKCLSSCIILLILTLNTEAQPKYTKQQLIEDLKVFKDILVNTNPIFEDAGRDSMEKKFSQAIRSFSMDSATGLEFMHYVSALKAKQVTMTMQIFCLEISYFLQQLPFF